MFFASVKIRESRIFTDGKSAPIAIGGDFDHFCRPLDYNDFRGALFGHVTLSNSPCKTTDFTREKRDLFFPP